MATNSNIQRAMLGLLSLSMWTALVLAQDDRPVDPNNHFIYPPLPGAQFSNDPTVFASNLNFTVDTLQAEPFKWTTNIANLSINLQQEGNPEVVHSVQIKACDDNVDNLYWDGKLGDINLDNGAVASLAAYDCGQPGSAPVFFSHYFNMTRSETTSAATPSATSTDSPSSSESSLANVFHSSTSGTDSHTESTPSTKTNKTALIVGLTTGIFALVLILGAALIKYRRRRLHKRASPSRPRANVTYQALPPNNNDASHAENRIPDMQQHHNTTTSYHDIPPSQQHQPSSIRNRSQEDHLHQSHPYSNSYPDSLSLSHSRSYSHSSPYALSYTNTNTTTNDNDTNTRSHATSIVTTIAPVAIPQQYYQMRQQPQQQQQQQQQPSKSVSRKQTSTSNIRYTELPSDHNEQD